MDVNYFFLNNKFMVNLLYHFLFLFMLPYIFILNLVHLVFVISLSSKIIFFIELNFCLTLFFIMNISFIIFKKLDLHWYICRWAIINCFNFPKTAKLYLNEIKLLFSKFCLLFWNTKLNRAMKNRKWLFLFFSIISEFRTIFFIEIKILIWLVRKFFLRCNKNKFLSSFLNKEFK